METCIFRCYSSRKRLKTGVNMNYKNAFECKDCPESEKGCPCWTEIIETNLQSGEERITKDCLYKLLPRLMVEVIKASNRPAAAVESMRNSLVANLSGGFSALVNAMEVRSLPKPQEDK